MKVLFVTARFPWPPDRGDRLTSLALLRVLSRDHQVTLLSCIDGSEPPEARAALEELGIRIETVRLPRSRSWMQAWFSLAGREPSQVAYYRSHEMRTIAEQLLARDRPDLVYVQLFRMAPVVDGLVHPAKVLFMGDSIALNLSRALHYEALWRRPMIAWERRRVAAFEVASAFKFREAWVVSSVDRDDLIARGATNTRLVPHGVDERYFDLQPARAPEPRLMFLGNLSVPHNVDAAVFAAREVLPELRRTHPSATLWLAGAAPRRDVRALATLPGVTVTGKVPDLSPMFAAAHLMLAPLRFSTGIQNKVLEAMAAGLPVVTTESAAAGVGVEARGLIRIAVDARGLAREAAAVLDDPVAAEAVAAQARRYARAHFSWSALGRELERVARESQAGYTDHG